MAKNEALEFLPKVDGLPEIDDWRTFLYRENGLSLTSQKATGVLETDGQYSLPHESILSKDILRPRSTPRHDIAVEAFFGKDFGHQPDGDPVGTMIVMSQYRNPLYGFLVWISLLVGITALFPQLGVPPRAGWISLLVGVIALILTIVRR